MMEKHMTGGSIGALIEDKLETAGVELPKGVSLKLTGMIVDNVPAGMITLPATEIQSGTIIIGPGTKFAGVQSKEQMLRGCRAYRWVLNPVRMRGLSKKSKPWDKNYIQERPSIVLENLTDLKCPVCARYKNGMNRDDINRISVDKDGKKVWKWNPTNKVLCRSCTDNPGVGQAVFMSQTRRRMSMFPAAREDTDSVFAGADDHRVDHLMDAWMMLPPAADALLPRIWAVYPMGQAPTDWAPDDPLAYEIESRYNAFIKGDKTPSPRTIRPLSHALKTQRKGEVSARLGVVMEAKPGIRTGWVPEELLAENVAEGFKMRFMKNRRGVSV